MCESFLGCVWVCMHVYVYVYVSTWMCMRLFIQCLISVVRNASRCLLKEYAKFHWPYHWTLDCTEKMAAVHLTTIPCQPEAELSSSCFKRLSRISTTITTNTLSGVFQFSICNFVNTHRTPTTYISVERLMNLSKWWWKVCLKFCYLQTNCKWISCVESH